MKQSLGASLVPEYWKVRVSGLSDIVDGPSDHLSIWNITLYGFMERLSHYIPFTSKE